MIKGAVILSLTLKEKSQKTEENELEAPQEVKLFDLVTWKVIQAYMVEDAEKPTMDIMKYFIDQLVGMQFPEKLNLRRNTTKFTLQSINSENSSELERLYLLFILSPGQSLEILDLEPIIPYSELVTRVEKKNKINEALEAIVKDKNYLLEKLLNKTLLQKQVGNEANELIDAGNYTEAQDLMKIAKEIPKKFVDTMQAAHDAIHNNKFRSAEKNLLNAYDLAKKLEDEKLETYLKLRIEKIQQIPAYHKQIKKLLKQINSNLSHFPSYLNYIINLPMLHESIDLFEKLEKDKEISDINQLIEFLEKAEELATELSVMDEKIQKILTQMSI